MPSSLAKTFENYSADWWTPPEWLKWAAATFGRPFPQCFDPCPGDWREGVDSDALKIQWERYCYVNHPGSRGSAQVWWTKAMDQVERRWPSPFELIWCAFNVEQLRHLRPSPLHLDGWLILPRGRTAFLWGGPDIPAKRDSTGKMVAAERKHGEPMKSPANWTVFWTNTKPATPPVEAITVRTYAQ